MPDRREHRGPHPEDQALFATVHVPILRSAVHDLSWLLSHGYSDAAAVKLVGDRYQLASRQRNAVRRCACSDIQRARRAQSSLPVDALAGERVAVDGFNVLTTIEAALAGGVILHARDGCHRDMASMHGSWKRVQETTTAVELLLRLLAAAKPATIRFILDRPVANSGRLAAIIRSTATDLVGSCEVELHDDADRALLESGAVIATADSGVLDRAEHWVDLTGPSLQGLSVPTWRVDLRPDD